MVKYDLMLAEWANGCPVAVLACPASPRLVRLLLLLLLLLWGYHQSIRMAKHKQGLIEDALPPDHPW